MTTRDDYVSYSLSLGRQVFRLKDSRLYEAATDHASSALRNGDECQVFPGESSSLSISPVSAHRVTAADTVVELVVVVVVVVVQCVSEKRT